MSSMNSPVQGASPGTPGNVAAATSSPGVAPSVVPGSPGSSNRTPGAGSRHRTPGSVQQRGSSVGPSPARSALGQRGQARVRADVNGMEESSTENIHTFIWGTKYASPPH